MGEMHSLLKRQIHKNLSANPTIPEKWQKLLAAVDVAYRENDEDREILERALELSSQEHVHLFNLAESVREISLGIASRTTLNDVLSFVIDSAGNIPGMRFIVVHSLDESGRNITTPYFSRFQNKTIINGLKKAGAGKSKQTGKIPESPEYQFPLASSGFFREYISNPRIIIGDYPSELFNDIFPVIVCDKIRRAGGIKKIVIIPLVVDNKFWGTMSFLHDGTIPPSALEMMAAHCSLGIRNVLNMERITSSREMIQRAFEATTEGIVTTDLNHRIMDINSAALKMHGYSAKKEIIGKTALVFLADQKDRNKLETLLKDIGQGQILAFASRLVKKDGSLFDVELNIAAIKDTDGKPGGFITSVRDITESKKAAENLKASERRLRDAQSIGRIGSYEIDLVTWNVIWSEEMYELFERDRNLSPPSFAEIPGYFPPEEYANYVDLSRRAVNEKKQLTQNIIARLPSGKKPIFYISIRPVQDENDRVVKIVGTIQDVTGRTEAEAKIIEQRALINSIVNTMPAVVLVVDNESKIIMANRSCCEIFKKPEGELIGKTIQEITSSAEIIQMISKAVSSDTSEITGEFIFNIDSHDKTFAANLLHMDKGNFLLIFNDITVERERQARLQLTDRLVSVGEMAAGVAHELNNPLTGIIGLAEWLTNSNAVQSAEAKEDLKLIYTEAQRAAEVVRNLLTFARQHKTMTKAVNIDDVLDSVLKLRAYEHKVNNIEIVRRIENHLPEIIADQFQLQQVFLNIILNAEQAMADGHGERTLTISTGCNAGNIVVSISDTGQGISPANMRKLFSPFFTTKEVGKGTGLGLSICYGIIASHGGRIYARSKVGKGTTFIIELPVKRGSK